MPQTVDETKIFHIALEIKKYTKIEECLLKKIEPAIFNDIFKYNSVRNIIHMGYNREVEHLLSTVPAANPLNTLSAEC